MNEQIVYYGYTNTIERPHGMFYGKEPTVAIKEFLDDANEVGFLKCPSYKDYMKNVFAVGSWFDLKLNVETEGLSTNAPQEFLNNYIKTHSDKRKVYQMLQTSMFIAEDASLQMTQEHPSMSDNLFTKHCSIISGTFDIGQYFRLISPAFFIKNGVDVVDIKENDTLFYLRFHTKKKIKFVPFFMSHKFEAFTRNCQKEMVGNTYKPLDFYYKVFKKKNLKKLIIKEIKKNLL